jgi:hypothetical protein
MKSVLHGPLRDELAEVVTTDVLVGGDGNKSGASDRLVTVGCVVEAMAG